MKILKTLGKIALGTLVGLIVIFVLFYLFTMGEYSVADTVAQDPDLPRLSIAGVTYHGQTFGNPDDPVVITVHGGPGGDYLSILSLQALSDRYFVVFYDQRGSGLSPRIDPEEITFASTLADLD
jgi:proline iminopeptidase